MDSDVTWERHTPPDPEHLAEAVLEVAGEMADYRAGARERAVRNFDLQPWLEAHRRVFEAFVAGGGGTSP